MSDYCEHDWPVNSNCPKCEIESLQQQLESTQRMCAEKDEALKLYQACVGRCMPHPSSGQHKPEKCPNCVAAKALQSTTCGQDYVHKSEVEKWMRDPEMPGAWKCDKCNFVLQKNVLFTSSGTMSADTSPLNEKCPNDGKLMRPLTWREVNKDLFEQCCKHQSSLTQRAIEELEKCSCTCTAPWEKCHRCSRIEELRKELQPGQRGQ